MNKVPIDIVVTYLDDSVEAWRDEYARCKQLELTGKITNDSNYQAFGPERYRNWHNFKYWFRSVEQNCPWVNKVFLLVKDAAHIPSWLNTKHPKLRIVYHDEFIPKELLPTFSVNSIEMFYYRIKDLSDHFITCNDDFFFINPIPAEKFFENDIIVQWIKKKPYILNGLTGEFDTWKQIIDNNNKFLKRYMKPGEECMYQDSHLPEPRVKSFEAAFMKEHYDEIFNSLKVSHFRNKKNYMSWLFIDMLKLNGPHIVKDNVYSNSKYLAMKPTTNLSYFKNCDMLCFNDTPACTNFEKSRGDVLNFLNEKFPNQCSFEKPFKLKPAIGIISYMPDNITDRINRIDSLKNLLKQIDQYFTNTDILIIAQNWNGLKLTSRNNNLIIKDYPALGIIGARKTLREEFLKLDNNYIIMFDDDAIFEIDNPALLKEYLKLMEQNPHGFAFIYRGNGYDKGFHKKNPYASSQLNFCAISKFLYNIEDIPSIDPQKNEGYEDCIWSYLLLKRYPSFEFKVPLGIRCIHWHNENINTVSTWEKAADIKLKTIGKNTNDILDFIDTFTYIPNSADEARALLAKLKSPGATPLADGKVNTYLYF